MFALMRLPGGELNDAWHVSLRTPNLNEKTNIPHAHAGPVTAAKEKSSATPVASLGRIPYDLHACMLI